MVGFKLIGNTYNTSSTQLKRKLRIQNDINIKIGDKWLMAVLVRRYTTYGYKE